MGVYDDTFDSVEEAVEALKGAIEERDGKFVVGGELRKRLGRAGLVASNKNVSIGELIELHMEAESPSTKPTTIKTKRNISNKLRRVSIFI